MGDNGHLQPSSRLPACIIARELKILETNLKFEEIMKFISYFCRFHCIYDHNCFVLLCLSCISHKRYLIGEVLKLIFFRNPRITKVLAVERDVKPQNMNFAKVDRRGGGTKGGLIRGWGAGMGVGGCGICCTQ